jgi:hypothetical protein
VLLGVPIGIGMTTITARVLTPVFSISPPLVRVPMNSVALLVARVLAAAPLVIAARLIAVARTTTVSVVRES